MTAKPFRFRFSLRTFAILVAIACFTLACWRWTKTWGVESLQSVSDSYAARRVVAVAPLILATDLEIPNFSGHGEVSMFRTYYVWRFIGSVKVPFVHWVYTYHDPDREIKYLGPPITQWQWQTQPPAAFPN